MIAARYLKGGREDGYVSLMAIMSMVGIMLGVATLIVVMSVMNGFQATLINQLLGLRGHILVESPAGVIYDYDTLTAEIETVDGVVSARPLVLGQALAVGPRQSGGVLVHGIQRNDLLDHDLAQPNADGTSKIVSGDLDFFEEGNSLVIGQRLADQVGIVVGDMLTLVSPQTTDIAFGSVPRMRDYQVVAIFSIGNVSFDSSTLFMPLADAQTYFRTGDAVTNIEIVVSDPRQVADIQARIDQTIDRPLQLLNWQELNASFVSALTVERNTMFVILVMIIFVAAFNIMSSLIMLVKDKGRDIAVLRTMGAPQSSVMKVFVLCGGLMGVVGSLAGVGLGLLLLEYRRAILSGIGNLFNVQFFPPDVYGIDGLPAQVDPIEIASIVLIALGLSLVMTLYPSWRASRLHPVEALRNE